MGRKGLGLGGWGWCKSRLSLLARIRGLGSSLATQNYLRNYKLQRKMKFALFLFLFLYQTRLLPLRNPAVDWINCPMPILYCRVLDQVSVQKLPTHMTSSCMLVISWGLLKDILFLFPFPRCPEKFSLFFFRFLCCVVSSVQSSFLTPHSASVLS